MNNLIQSILKTAVYFLDQTNQAASDVRDRVSDTVDRASDRMSDLRSQAEDLYEGVGVGAAILFAPASGQDIRNSIGEKVQDIGDRVRGRFSSEAKNATGTEGR